MSAHKHIRYLLIVCILFSLGSMAFGQDVNQKAVRLNLIQEFNQRFNNKWEITINSKTSTPSNILGYKIDKYSGDPVSIAKALLNEHKEMFGIKFLDKDLVIQKTRYSKRGGTRILFTQVYKDVPVLNSGYLIAVDDESSIYYISGDYYPELDLDVDPKYSIAYAEEVMKSNVGDAVIESINKPELFVYPKIDGPEIEYRLVFRGEIRTSKPLEIWRFTIDAHDGSIFLKEKMFKRINGDGDVYTTNPNHDNVVNRTLHRLRDISPRKLDGDNVIVYNDEGSEASSSIASFVYSSTNTHFDEVMSYYHCDEFEAWLINKGLGPQDVNKVTVHTHYWDDPYLYAGADVSNRIIYFDDSFSGLNNPTKEAAVIAHEYMHIVSETFNSLTACAEALAMDEAYSDYFAVAYTNQFYNDHTIGEYIDQPDGYYYQRHLVNSNTTNEWLTIDIDLKGGTEEHDRCVIFSGALWDFRRDGDVNSSVADELVLESLNNLDAYPYLKDGRAALLSAATSSGYSQYTDDIDDAFYNHRIPWIEVSISGPLALLPSQQGTWSASVQYGRGTTSYQWYVKYDGSGTWTTLGTSQNQSLTFYTNNTINELKCVLTKGDQTGQDIKPITITSGGFPKLPAPISSVAPKDYALHQNHANPFNPTTEIKYDLPEGGYVQLNVFNALGQRVRTLVSEDQSVGFKSVVWDGKDDSGRAVVSGVYIYRLHVQPADHNSSPFQAVKKMSLMR